MSAPSAHPNCCARRPSLSSPVYVCLRNLLSFIFQMALCLALKKVYTGREGQNLEIYLLLWKKHCHNFCQNWIFNRLFMSQYCSLLCEKWWWLVCYAVADLASGISVLWPHSVLSDIHTLVLERSTYLMSGALWTIRQLHKCVPLPEVLSLPSEQLFCCKIYIVPLKKIYYAWLAHFIYHFQ